MQNDGVVTRACIDITKPGFPESCHDLYSREYHL
jgi:hypothetical protein